MFEMKAQIEKSRMPEQEGKMASMAKHHQVKASMQSSERGNENGKEMASPHSEKQPSIGN